jgi:KDO2-lipid IV(A) lauroyltransferase
MMLRPLLHHLEAALAQAALTLVAWLPPAAASAIGGALARTIGPLLPVSRVADDNLRRALPALDAAARRRVIRGVWDNLGRTMGEFPHVRALGPSASGPGWELAGQENVDAVLASGRPVIAFSGHIANWELNAAAGNVVFRRTLGIFYRAASNPVVDRLVVRVRDARGAPHFPKGVAGARAAMAFLRQGGSLGMLVDQKMNDGIPVPFFGRPAMTAPAAAAMAQRFGCLLVPCHMERLGAARFRFVVEPPFEVPDSGDRHADIAAATRRMNACLERWITARPQEWLWLHRRWPRA